MVVLDISRELLVGPNHRVITNEEGKSLLIGPAGSALQVDNQNRITKVISAPHGMFHKTRDGQVVALVDGQAQPIGQMDGPIDSGFINQFNTPNHEQPEGEGVGPQQPIKNKK